MKRISPRTLWLLGSLALALAVPPLLLRAAPDGYDHSRRRMAELPEPEVAQIERNFELFLRMDEAERDHYRRMHHRLEADRTEGEGVYTRLLENYSAWLRTIRPHRREQLRQTTDPQQRIELMAEILIEEREREVQELMEIVSREIGGRPFPGSVFHRLGAELISTGDLRSIMREVERSARLRSQQRDELAGLTGIPRYFRFFEMLVENREPLARSLSDADVERIIAVLPEGDVKQRLLQEEAGSRRPFVLGLVIRSLWTEYQIEVHQRRQPSAENLTEFLNSLPAAEQDFLLSLMPDRFERELRERYLSEVEDLDFDVVLRGALGISGEEMRERWRRRRGRPDGDPRSRGDRPSDAAREDDDHGRGVPRDRTPPRDDADTRNSE